MCFLYLYKDLMQQLICLDQLVRGLNVVIDLTLKHGLSVWPIVRGDDSFHELFVERNSIGVR